MVIITCVATAHLTSLAKAVHSLKIAVCPELDFIQIYPPDVQEGRIVPDDFRHRLRKSDVILMDIRGTGMASDILLHELDQTEKIVLNLLPRADPLQDLTRLGHFSWNDFFSNEKKDRKSRMSGGTGLPGDYLRTLQDTGAAMPEKDPGREDMRLYIRLCKYWINGGEENFLNLILTLVCRLAPAGSLPEPADPVEYPPTGIFHPAFGHFTTLAEYYAAVPADPEKPTIGFLFHGAIHLEQILPTLEKFIAALPGCNILPVYGFDDSLTAMNGFFRSENQVLVDAIVNLRWFRIGMGLYGADNDVVANLLQDLNVPIFCPVCMFNQEILSWDADTRGLAPLLAVMAVMWPESDGCIEPVPCCGLINRSVEGTWVKAVVPIEDRVERIAGRIQRWTDLKYKPNSEKRLAFILYNSPPGEGNVGGGYLDVSASMHTVLTRLRDEGYTVEIPDKNLAKLFEEKAILNLGTWQDISAIARSSITMDTAEYLQYFQSLPDLVQRDVISVWGLPPGSFMTAGSKLVIPGMQFGNVFIGLQPARPPVTAEDPSQALHDQNTPPHHQYLAFYAWLRDTFRADAIVHVATHGSAEFTKGKEIGLSSACFPDILIGEIPHLYFYHLANTAEASIAKRRMYATMISYNSPPFTVSDLYDDYRRLEDLLNEHAETGVLQEHVRCALVEEKIAKLADSLSLTSHDPVLIRDELAVMKRTIIPSGMHILGRHYTDDEILQTLTCMLRFDHLGTPSLHRVISAENGWNYDTMLLEPGKYSRELEVLDTDATAYIRAVLTHKETTASEVLHPDNDSRTALRSYILDLAGRLQNNTLELSRFLNALNGGFTPTRLGGDVIRNPAVLPTGANIHQFDPLAIPTDTACERGRRIALNTIEVYREDQGTCPESVGIVLWGFETTKTGGETVGQVLEYLGLRISRARFSFEPQLDVIPVVELGHPRIDCHISISGIFRDTFPTVIRLLDQAFRLVSALDEGPEINYVRAHTRDNAGVLEKSVTEGILSQNEADEIATGRIYGPRAGGYGTGILPLLEDSAWKDESDLADIYAKSMSHLYTGTLHGSVQTDQFRTSINNVTLVSQVRDASDIDIIDLDHYFEFFGGLAKTVETSSGKRPVLLISDTSSELIRTEDVETMIARGVRTRLLNPKWIDGMLAHEYHGAQSIGERVYNLLGLASTTNAVAGWIWSSIAERYIFDEDLLQRMEENNQFATKHLMDRLFEAAQRGYWAPSLEEYDRLLSAYMKIEGDIEAELE